MSTAEGRRYIRSERFTSLKEHVAYIVTRTPHPERGWTTPELVSVINRETPDTFATYSNPVSGALSRLHNVDRRIVRLKAKRGGFNVYVPNTHEGISGREFYEPRPPRPPDEEAGGLAPATVLDVINGIHYLHEHDANPHSSLDSVMQYLARQAAVGRTDLLVAAIANIKEGGPR